MLRQFRIVALVLALVLLLAAASSGDERFDVRVLLATMAIGILVMVGRYVVARDRQLLQFENDVSGALWGPRDANGKRNIEAGVVAAVNRMAADLPRAIEAAERAARSAEAAAESSRAATLHVGEATRQIEQASAYAVVAGDAARTAREIAQEIRDAKRRG